MHVLSPALKHITNTIEVIITINIGAMVGEI